MLLLVDSWNNGFPAPDYRVVPQNSSSAQIHSQRHSGGANLLWLDGHVTWENHARIVNEIAPASSGNDTNKYFSPAMHL